MLDKSIIIKLESPNEFTLGEITKITGHIMAKFMPAGTTSRKRTHKIDKF